MVDRQKYVIGGDSQSLPSKKIISDNRTFIMGVAMLAVMLFHQPWFHDHGVDTFFLYYGSWGVDFFLFVSGFGIAHSLEKNTIGTYFRNRIVRILPYCIAYGVVRGLLYCNGIHGFTPKYHPSVGLVFCCLDLWYIEAILLFYLVAPLFKKVVERWVWLAFMLSIIIWLMPRYIETPDFFADYQLLKRSLWAIGRLPVFVLGMCMYKCIDQLPRKVLVYSGIVLMLCAMVIKLAPISSILKENMMMFVCLSTPGISLLIAGCRQYIERLHLLNFFHWLGRNSLYVYMSHEFVYWTFHNHLYCLGGLLSFTLSLLVIYGIVTTTNCVENTIKTKL